MIQMQFKTTRERTTMTKKFVMSMIVSCALLFTVAFQSPVEAANESPKHEIKKQLELQLTNLLNEKVDSRITHALQFYMNKWYVQFDQHGNKQLEHVPATGENKAEQHVPKQDQPKQEQQEPAQETNKDKGQDQQQQQNVPKQEQLEHEPVTPPQQQQEQPRQPEQQEQTTNQGQLSQFEQEVIELTNVERSKAGLAPLKADVELSHVARDKSRD